MESELTYKVKVQGSDGKDYLAEFPWLADKLRPHIVDPQLGLYLGVLSAACSDLVQEHLRKVILITVQPGRSYRYSKVLHQLKLHGRFGPEFVRAWDELHRQGILETRKSWTRLKERSGHA